MPDHYFTTGVSQVCSSYVCPVSIDGHICKGWLPFIAPDQGKQTSIFLLQKTNKCLLYPFSVYIYCTYVLKQQHTYIYSYVKIYLYTYIFISISLSIYLYIFIYIYTCIYLDIDICCCYNRKTEHKRPGNFALIHLPFSIAHCANRSFSFVRLLMIKQTEAIHLQTDNKLNGLNGLAHLCL